MDKKVVIITGASSGIGQACAFEFASLGYAVSLGARNIDKLNKIRDSLTNKGNQVIAIKTDVSKEEDCKNLINKTVETFGRIDVLINNAGISMRALFKDVQIHVIRTLMEVNFFGTVYCSKYALPYLLEQKGSLVAITSIAGFHGLPGRTGYSASKFAIHGLLETIRIENLKNGLHVMIAAPGFTTSNVRKSALLADGSPQGESPRSEDKMMTPEEVARKIYDGIKHRRRNIILTLEGKFTVFFQRILPHTLDKIFYRHLSKEKNSPFK